MNSTDTLILDYGGVISQTIPTSILEELYELVFSGNKDIMGKDSFIELYYLKRSDFDKGLIDGKVYWKGIGFELNISLSSELIEKLADMDLYGWSGFNKPMLELIDILSSRGVDLVLLSNMSKDMKEYLSKNAPWLDLFKNLIFSCDYNIIKPDHKIFQETLRVSGKDPSQVLFVDDTLENILAAREIGINSLHFIDNNDIERIFDSFNI